MGEEIKDQVEKIKSLSDEIEKGAEEASAAGKSETAEAVSVKKSFSEWPVIRWFVNNKTAGALVGKSILLLLIPYVYLFILCWIFDSLKNYQAAGFILYSSIAFWIINIALIVYSIVRFIKHKKG